jgi:hypothetical protein
MALSSTIFGQDTGEIFGRGIHRQALERGADWPSFESAEDSSVSYLLPQIICSRMISSHSENAYLASGSMPIKSRIAPATSNNRTQFFEIVTSNLQDLPIQLESLTYERRHKSPLAEYLDFQKSLNGLHDFFEVKNLGQVHSFLRRNGYLVELIFEIASKLKLFFPETIYILDFKPGYDDDMSDTIVIYIKTDKSVDGALEELAKFDSSWWLENQERSRGRVVVDVEFL